MKSLADRLQDNKHRWGDCYLIMTVYMIGPEDDFLEVNFPYTKPEEVVKAVRSLENRGYRHCSKTRYYLRILKLKYIKWFADLKIWLVD